MFLETDLNFFCKNNANARAHTHTRKHARTNTYIHIKTHYVWQADSIRVFVCFRAKRVSPVKFDYIEDLRVTFSWLFVFQRFLRSVAIIIIKWKYLWSVNKAIGARNDVLYELRVKTLLMLWLRHALISSPNRGSAGDTNYRVMSVYRTGGTNFCCHRTDIRTSEHHRHTQYSTAAHCYCEIICSMFVYNFLRRRRFDLVSLCLPSPS